MLLDISISKPRQLKAPKPEFRIARRFDDGTVEVIFANGRRVRKLPFACLGCGRERVEHGFNTASENLQRLNVCPACFDKEARERAAAKLDRRLNGETPAERRYVAFVLASPDWRDRVAIARVYAEAERLTVETGRPHEVDHIYPIQSVHACGLHVHWNLQILEKGQNRSKKNKFPLFDSPALHEKGVENLWA